MDEAAEGEWGEEWKGRITKHEKTIGNNVYFDCVDGFMGYLSIRQNA